MPSNSQQSSCISLISWVLGFQVIHHAWLHYFSTRASCCVAQAGLKLLGSSKSPASASQVAGTTSVCFPAFTWRCLVKHTQIPILSQSRLHVFWVFVEPVSQGIRVYPHSTGFLLPPNRCIISATTLRCCIFELLILLHWPVCLTMHQHHVAWILLLCNKFSNQIQNLKIVLLVSETKLQAGLSTSASFSWVSGITDPKIILFNIAFGKLGLLKYMWWWEMCLPVCTHVETRGCQASLSRSTLATAGLEVML